MQRMPHTTETWADTKYQNRSSHKSYRTLHIWQAVSFQKLLSEFKEHLICILYLSIFKFLIRYFTLNMLENKSEMFMS